MSDFSDIQRFLQIFLLWFLQIFLLKFFWDSGNLPSGCYVMIHPENSYELPPIISHREIRFLQIFLEIGSTNSPGISVSDSVGMLLNNFSGIFFTDIAAVVCSWILSRDCLQVFIVPSGISNKLSFKIIFWCLQRLSLNSRALFFVVKLCLLHRTTFVIYIIAFVVKL